MQRVGGQEGEGMKGRGAEAAWARGEGAQGASANVQVSSKVLTTHK